MNLIARSIGNVIVSYSRLIIFLRSRFLLFR